MNFFLFAYLHLNSPLPPAMKVYFLCNTNRFPSVGPSACLLLGILECMGKLNQVLLAPRHRGKGHPPFQGHFKVLIKNSKSSMTPPGFDPIPTGLVGENSVTQHRGIQRLSCFVTCWWVGATLLEGKRWHMVKLNSVKLQAFPLFRSTLPSKGVTAKTLCCSGQSPLHICSCASECW